MTAKEILQDEVKNNPEGYEIFFDYREKIDSSDIAEAFERYSESVKEAKEKGTENDYPSFETFLEDYIYDKWDLALTSDQQLHDTFNYNRSQEEQDIVHEYLEENDLGLGEALDAEGFAGITWKLSDIMDDYHMNLMLATPNERNTDMGSISDMFYDAKQLSRNLDNCTEEYQDKHFDNALSYLVHQQGSKISDVAAAYYGTEEPKNEFIKSVVDELNDATYSMEELTVLVTLDKNGLELLDSIAKGEGNIEMSKDTMIGLFNEWNGSGSLLEIQLDKPLVVPADMIRNVQIEGQPSNSINGYTVNDVYGLVGEAWKGTIEKTDADSGRETIMESIKNDVGNAMDVIKEAAEKEKNERTYD